MSYTVKDHIKKAKRVLEKNWTGSYTMPASSLYPHQWNWDSGFIAIGYSHYDTRRAITELTSLFKGQWKNGMLPHIVFNKDKLGHYFPEPDFWQAHLAEDSPEDVLTSGITMPPVHALAVLKIYERAKKPEETLDFLRWIYPKLIKMHRYFYHYRDPEGVGLACIRHPWESGMDNSPMWEKVMKSWDIPKKEIPAYERL
ncbi:MAG: glycoside hydrolase, partial [Nitrospirae bacterium]